MGLVDDIEVSKPVNEVVAGDKIIISPRRSDSIGWRRYRWLLFLLMKAP